MWRQRRPQGSAEEAIAEHTADCVGPPQGTGGFQQLRDMVALRFQQAPSGYCAENRLCGQGRKQGAYWEATGEIQVTEGGG